MEQIKKLKINYFKDEKSVIEEISSPALLIGNGVNYLSDSEKKLYEKSDTIYISWKELLLSSFPEEKKKELNFNLNDDIEKLLPGLSYPEIAELSELLLKKNKEDNEKKYRNDFKESISQKLIKIDSFRKNENLNVSHQKIIQRAKENDWPILSTNYDHLLFSTLGFRKTSVTRFLGKEIEEPYLIDEQGNNIAHNGGSIVPINLYFRDVPFSKNDDITQKFAIWNIHGTKRFPGSICINNRDYAKLTGKIEESFKDLYSKDIEHPWQGRYFWPNIFLNNDLIIMGLELSFAETDLRSLLVKRHEHIQKTKKDIKTYFLYTDYDTNNNKFQKGKELFFNELGITCIKLSPEDIYSLNFIS